MPPIRQRTIHGEPIHVGQKEFVPEARVTWWLHRQATIGERGVNAQGGGFVSVRPTAILERQAGRERRIVIKDQTAPRLAGFAAGAVVIWFLAQVAVQLAKTSRR